MSALNRTFLRVELSLNGKAFKKKICWKSQITRGWMEIPRGERKHLLCTAPICFQSRFSLLWRKGANAEWQRSDWWNPVPLLALLVVFPAQMKAPVFVFFSFPLFFLFRVSVPIIWVRVKGSWPLPGLDNKPRAASFLTCEVILFRALMSSDPSTGKLSVGVFFCSPLFLLNLWSFPSPGNLSFTTVSFFVHIPKLNHFIHSCCVLLEGEEHSAGIKAFIIVWLILVLERNNGCWIQL